MHYYIDHPVLTTENEFVVTFGSVLPTGNQNGVDGVEAFGFAKQIGVFRLCHGEVYFVCCGGNINTSPFETRVDYVESNFIARAFEFIVTYLCRVDRTLWQTSPVVAAPAVYETVDDPAWTHQYNTWFKPLAVTMGIFGRRWKYFDFMYYNRPRVSLPVVPENLIRNSVFLHAWLEFPMYWIEYVLSLHRTE